MCYNISGKFNFFLCFFTEVGDNKTNEPDNEEESTKEFEGEEAKEEITLNKALEMANKLKMHCLRKGIPDVHSQSQVSDIADKIMIFTTKKPPGVFNSIIF